MRKLILTAALLTLPSLASAQESDEEWLQHCRSNHNRYDNPKACAVQVKSLPARSLLTVRPGQNGAVQFVAHEGKDIEVHARLQAGASNGRDAEELLKDIRVDLGQTVAASGPETGRNESWSASFVIYVPRNTNIDAKTQNGPISVMNVIGKMELSAQNGPVQLSGVGGDVHARAQNGPLQIRLTGTRWVGEGLDAETQNGPVQMSIPANYNAALETGTINGPMDTSFPLTVTMNGRSWKRISTTLGSGGPTVRAVTTNGPVSLKRP
jgi:hypothetical protein